MALALALLAALVILAVLLVGALATLLFGLRTYVIYGSSMEPTIKVGSLVAAEPVSVDDLRIGDVVVYRSGGNRTTVTHRITDIRTEGGERLFETKGDASNGADPLEMDFAGGVQQVIYHVPYVGYFVNFAKSPLAIVLLIVLPALGLVALQLSGRRASPPEHREAAGGA